jgi:sarcosine oxidase gamma subunit
LIPGRIEAEAYVAERDTTPGNQGDPSACGVFGNTDMERTADPNGGSCHVGWVASGEWLEYDVRVNETRAFDITARLASPYSNRRLHVEVDGVNMTGSLVAPNQGWQWFENATAYNVVIPAGDHRLRVYIETDGLNLNHIEFTPSNTNRGRVAIPARIEAEAYVGSSDTTFGNGGNASACGIFGDTDMGPSGDATGGCTVGWVAPGEWLTYDVAVGSVQTFDITARLASAYSGRSIRIEVDGVNVTGSMFAPANGWQNYSNVVRRNVVMSPGIRRVRVYMQTDALNLNYIQFTPAGQ